ncbi:MAG: hypothetical protein ABWY10_08255, partial [Tardiphaga sp.]
KRILIQNLVSSNANLLPSVIAGLAGHPIEDLKLSDILVHHVGGAPAAMARVRPPEEELGYPEATMFGDLPATGFFIRHARRIAMRDVEVAVATPDLRPAFRLEDVADADFAGVRVPKGPAFSLENVVGFRSTGGRWLKDRMVDGAISGTF